MRLNRLMKQVAPLPWRIERSNIKGLRLRAEVFSGSKDSHTSMPILIGESAPVLLAVHAVRVLPRVMEALRAISHEYECTCVSHHSWYGEGHCSGCPCAWVGDLLKEINEVGSATSPTNIPAIKKSATWPEWEVRFWNHDPKVNDCRGNTCKGVWKARTKVEAIRKAKAWNASLREIALFRLCEVKKK